MNRFLTAALGTLAIVAFHLELPQLSPPQEANLSARILSYEA
jgi:hypothetical protein